MKENSIEKDKEILNNIKAFMQESINKGCNKFIYNDLGYDEKCVDVINAIEHILSDYKRTLKENEELEEINNELEAEKNEAIRRYNFETIPIKKIKDKIEELNKEIKSCTEIDAIFKIKQQQILQELLGDK